LEELSIKNNFLTVLDGIENLSSLRRLNVSNNEITDFEGQIISNLTRLSYLAIDHNRLYSLGKLGRCLTLIELYAGNNLIRNFIHSRNLDIIEFTYIRFMGKSDMS
jgi:Leucine-rich repeat (LRR) protein